MVNVAVLGAGSWGTTLAKVFADAGNAVDLWARRPELARTIETTRENPDYLPGITLPDAVSTTTSGASSATTASSSGPLPTSATTSIVSAWLSTAVRP